MVLTNFRGQLSKQARASQCGAVREGGQAIVVSQCGKPVGQSLVLHSVIHVQHGGKEFFSLPLLQAFFLH